MGLLKGIFKARDKPKDSLGGSRYNFFFGSTTAGKPVNEQTAIKIEPIKWKVIYSTGGTATLLCENIITAMQFNTIDAPSVMGETVLATDYSNSLLRFGLNNKFIELAFLDDEREKIKATEIDNSAKSTGNLENENFCSNTRDKVFVLSFEEVTNEKYGFVTDAKAIDMQRVKKATDSAIAAGAKISTSTANYGSGWWWTRSPDIGNQNYIRVVGRASGADYYSMADQKQGGVVPAIIVNN